MNPESYDQRRGLAKTWSATPRAYLQDGMTVQLSTHNDVPIALELPRTVVTWRSSTPNRR